MLGTPISVPLVIGDCRAVHGATQYPRSEPYDQTQPQIRVSLGHDDGHDGRHKSGVRPDRDVEAASNHHDDLADGDHPQDGSGVEDADQVGAEQLLATACHPEHCKQ
jgi:hypothetical protein